MAKSKSKTTIMAADGAGGMMKVPDRRFESGDWPIRFEIPVEGEQADRWTRYLSAECHRRGWSSAGQGQLERAENSGTIVLTSSGIPQLEMVWERKRDRGLKVKARAVPSSPFSSADVEQFCNGVTDACARAVTEPISLRGTLQYDGLPWRGELWLDDTTRLASPSVRRRDGSYRSADRSP